MAPKRLTALMEEKGTLEKQAADQVFHAQAFPRTMFMLKTGYVKRYQVTKGSSPVIELIYGPSHIFPLSQLYRKLFGVEMNQQDLIYVYQTMTDIEIYRLSDDEIIAELEKSPHLYVDLFYEAGLRLRSNIDRLASNAIKDDKKKVAHQLACLAEEFGKTASYQNQEVTKIAVPLEAKDVAEQLNISVAAAADVLKGLHANKQVIFDGTTILIPDIAVLKDVYL